jgi:hypothetical protein
MERFGGRPTENGHRLFIHPTNGKILNMSCTHFQINPSLVAIYDGLRQAMDFLQIIRKDDVHVQGGRYHEEYNKLESLLSNLLSSLLSYLISNNLIPATGFVDTSSSHVTNQDYGARDYVVLKDILERTDLFVSMLNEIFTLA